MRDLVPQISQWFSEGKQLAVATVIGTRGSSLRGLGAKMVFAENGLIAGSLSGGCVEGAVFEAGLQVLQTGRPRRLHFGRADEDDWGVVGLSCGGQIEVFINRLDEDFFRRLNERLLAGRPFFLATLLDGPADLVGQQIMLSDTFQPDRYVLPALVDAIRVCGQSISSTTTAWSVPLRSLQGEPVEAFVEAVDSQPTLVIVGATHIAVTLVTIAKTLGYRTIVIDPRGAFGNAERFPHVDQLLSCWPQAAFERIAVDHNTAIVMLTHDAKLDDPALEIALQSPAFYVGALGSAHTQKSRRTRLLRKGVQPDQLDALYGPVGLDLGGETPAEIALEIMAEIVAVQRRASRWETGSGCMQWNSPEVSVGERH